MLKNKKLWIPLLTAGIFLALFVIFAVYVNMDYPALEEVGEWLVNNADITYESKDNAYIVSKDNHKQIGILFYPGAKVEETAYLPLLKQLAEKGYYCVCIKMPFRMAVFGVNLAGKVIDNHEEIKEWYLMGHSLGGAMAASFAESHQDSLNGLIFLAAYAANDLSGTKLPVFSLYGSRDLVLNKEKYKQSLKNLPGNYEEMIIEGGNHAQFGNYGKQKGDGEPEITRDEQQKQTVEAIAAFIQNHS